jgi:hypothetical protein
MTYKPLNASDTVSTRTLLHEAIPLTGTIVSGTYADENIKNFAHGMFQSVYDYPYLSSSANHIFDITLGVHAQGLATSFQTAKKKNIYNQMAQVLMGYDATGSVQRFDEDGDLLGTGQKLNEVFIVPFSRLLSKDEIKKETFELTLGVNPSYTNQFGRQIIISDYGASTEYRVNSPVGEYGILYARDGVTGGGSTNLRAGSTHKVSIGGIDSWYAGLIFYQAGVMVLTASVLMHGAHGQLDVGSDLLFTRGGDTIDAAIPTTSISGAADDFRRRIKNIQFNNTTELNSTVYFCRANHNEFNYSSNPTYVNESKVRVKTQATDDPVSYITTVGLYNDNNELMATAKLSEPLKKNPSTEYTIRVRLDY